MYRLRVLERLISQGREERGGLITIHLGTVEKGVKNITKDCQSEDRYGRNVLKRHRDGPGKFCEYTHKWVGRICVSDQEDGDTCVRCTKPNLRLVKRD